MKTAQHVKESLSRAYVQAIAARAGVNIAVTQEHDYGVDGTFRRVQVRGHRWTETGFPVDFQLKASVTWELRGDEIVYDLEAKNYNDLAERSHAERAAPLILLLLCLPKNEQDWTTFSEEELIMRRCCYWHLLTGVPTVNAETQRISIPRSQLLTPESLDDLLRRTEQGDLA